MLDSSLQVNVGRVRVHPLGLPKHQERTEPDAVDSGHQVEDRSPGARRFDQVASQVHTDDSWAQGEEREMHRLWGRILPARKDELKEGALPRRAPPVFPTPVK